MTKFVEDDGIVCDFITDRLSHRFIVVVKHPDGRELEQGFSWRRDPIGGMDHDDLKEAGKISMRLMAMMRRKA